MTISSYLLQIDFGGQLLYNTTQFRKDLLYTIQYVLYIFA